MTYNIRYDNPRDGKDVWRNRVDAVVDLIAKQDVIGLQEVTAGQLDALVARLVDFQFYGLGRDDGKRGGEHAPIFFRKERFEQLDRGTFWLSQRPAEVGVAGWDASLPRTCTWMLLKDKTTGSNLWVANAHFDHRGSKSRLESGRLITKVVRDQVKDMPTIVMGDFNCLPRSPPYQALIDGNLLIDARKASKQKVAGPDSTWNGFRGVIPERIIDHVFVGGPIEVEQLSTLDPKTASGRFASDHLPVRILMRLMSSGPSQN
jgi:endonuclease/exonuclease/phosphatase family metal-dependent hydrolase